MFFQFEPWLAQLHWTFSGEAGRLLVTFLVLAAGAAGLKAAQRYLGGHVDDRPNSRDRARRRYLWVRNVIGVACVLAICTIWASKLSGLALSLAAVAGAILIVSKEMLLCGLGYVFITFSRSFNVGDFIEVGTAGGQVLDVDLFATTLMETGAMHHFTGRRLSVPNASFFTTPVRNLSTTGHFVVDTLSLTIPFDFDLRRVEALALESARAVCSDWQADALRHMERLGAVELVALPNAEPKAIFEPVDAKESNLLIRFACPAQRRAAAKQELMKAFWGRLATEGLIGARRDLPATVPEDA
ncbi:MAG: mechanosensitive ion channel family protein [Burkholderiaceae bacterium]|nr:mechanosensitive ion channel family protein [Burkholderiaceae bacterium]